MAEGDSGAVFPNMYYDQPKTDLPKKDWEVVSKCHYLKRIEVPGGWIYSHSSHLVFVPYSEHYPSDFKL